MEFSSAGWRVARRAFPRAAQWACMSAVNWAVEWAVEWAVLSVDRWARSKAEMTVETKADGKGFW